MSNRDLLLAAMGSQLPALRESAGDEFEPLCEYLEYACYGQGWQDLGAAIRRQPVARTMVITGERCTGALADGSDSPIIQGMIRVAEMLYPYATKKPGLARNGREPDALSILFSGGQMLTREMGELPGSELATQFKTLTGDMYASYVQHENLSLNTGDQGAVLGGLMWARNPERVVIVHVVDHIARFAATLMAGWRANRDGRLVDAQRHLKAGRITQEQYDSLNRAYPEVYLLSVGSFSDLDPRRGKGAGISRAQEAFGPVQTDEEAMVPGKKLGDEYGANRYLVECLQGMVGKSIGYACRALPPSEMLQILQATRQR